MESKNTAKCKLYQKIFKIDNAGVSNVVNDTWRYDKEGDTTLFPF